MGNTCCNEEPSEGKPVEHLPTFDVTSEYLEAERKAKANAEEAAKNRKGEEATAAEEEEVAKQGENVKQEDVAKEEEGKKESSDASAKTQEKETAAEVASNKICEFQIDLKKVDPSKWGFKIYVNEDHMVINDACGPAFEEWHKNNPAKKVIFGDQVVSLNGNSGDTKSLTEVLNNSTEITIVFRRQLEICVTAKKPLGLRLEGESNFTVTAISDGGIKAYNDNDATPPFVNIGPGDVLESVNGKTADVLEEIKNAEDEVTLMFTRPPFDQERTG